MIAAFNDWVVAVEGRPAGATAAMILALVSAVAHATFGALQKGRHDPWLTRGAIDFFYLAIALPTAIFIVPPLEREIWPIMIGVWAIHTVYKLFQSMAYTRGAYTVVYPVVRGMGPLATVVFAGIVFGELFAPGQWLGVALLSGGIMSLAVLNLRTISIGSETLVQALGLAVLAGLMVAVYTTYDAYGIRLTAEPLTFIVWYFVIDGWTFPIIAAVRYRRMAAPPTLAPLMLRGLIGALIAFLSFGSVMLATRLDKVGEAAALRETSTIFAALIGWLFLKETVGPRRAALMAVIAFGAVLVEFG